MQKQDVLSHLKHIQLLRSLFITVGAWPTELFEGRSRRKFIAIFLSVVTAINIFGEFNYIAKKYQEFSFFHLGDVLLTDFISVLTLGLTLIPSFKCYGLVVKEFITKFHLVNYRSKAEYYQKIYDKINKFSHYFSLLLLSYSIVGPICFNFVPFYNNYINGVFNNNIKENYTLQFSVYFLHSWFNPEEHFIAASIINCYLSYFCGQYVCGFDLLVSLMAFQIIGHIKALKHELRALPKPKQPIVIEVFSRRTNTRTSLSVEVYDDHENSIIRQRIMDFVDHHRTIVNFAGSVSRVFGPLLALTYLHNLISCALLLLVCTQGEPETIARFGPVTLIVFYQLIQISVTFEVIGSESDKLKDEVYDVPWESMNVSNQKLMWIFLNRIQIPIRVTALGMVEVGVRTMASILRTTLSYFALLRSMGE